jgi:hypothetical protein
VKLTRDHIPPRSLFARPFPSNLITVPACAACHGPTTGDDEYFRLAMAFNSVALAHPVLQQLETDVMRALTKPTKAGFARSTWRMTRRGFIQLTRHLSVPAMAFGVDRERLARVVERITRGLYFRHRGVRIPAGYSVTVADELHFDMEGADIVQAKLDAQPVIDIANGVFTYRYCYREERDPGVSAWLMTFYGAVKFVGMTTPKR